MSSAGAARRAAVSVSSTRTEASRKNGARSRGPTTPEGKARSAQNALKHGLRAEKYVVLPQEDGAEFEALEAALMEELAPVGALQAVLARRVAVAAWRLMRADRLEAEVFAFRSYDAAGPGLALIREGNGTRSFETLLRYRGAAMAEFWRALKTLKALQAEQAHQAQQAGRDAGAPVLEAPTRQPRPPAPVAAHPAPNEPGCGAGRPLDYVLAEPAVSARTLHEPTGRWLPNQPELAPAAAASTSRREASRTNPNAAGPRTRSGDRAVSRPGRARG